MKSFIDIKEPLQKQYTLSEYRNTDNYNDITTYINTDNKLNAYKEAYNLLLNSCNEKIDVSKYGRKARDRIRHAFSKQQSS